MSIAGIAKEVTTITVSAWFFGDQLTPLNITGVSITICGTSYANKVFNGMTCICIQGIILFTYHKYRRSIDSVVPLDSHGNPMSAHDSLREVGDEPRGYYVELEETMRLTSDPRASYDLEEVTRS
jgi:solute carrier family 35 protein C2